jgi:hypothetical protein
MDCDSFPFKNSVWNTAHPDSGEVIYDNEAGIVHLVMKFLEDAVLALNLLATIRISSEVGFKNIQSDLCSLKIAENLMVGVVEGKRPGHDILIQPTVLGELYDQMQLVEGFYGTGPVCGILTTGVEWLIAWFPTDDDCFASSCTPFAAPSSFSTPLKGGSKQEGSPEGTTPSQKGGICYGINDYDSLEMSDDNADIGPECDRILHTTKVLNIYEDKDAVLKTICTALTRMAQAKRGHKKSKSVSFLKFHRDSNMITWHSSEFDSLSIRVSFNHYPRSNTKTLVALEDLGRGSSGKAWLAVTISTCPGVCVLKFHNKDDTLALEQEKKKWDLVYPEFKKKVKVEKWSGSHALMMPHFADVVQDKRESLKEAIVNLLTIKFEQQSLVHNDVRWRNIGIYSDMRSGEVVPVIYDLESVKEYDHEQHEYWFERAMTELYPNGIG